MKSNEVLMNKPNYANANAIAIAIVSHADQIGADLIVIGARGQTKVE
jgi:hypothetical protein